MQQTGGSAISDFPVTHAIKLELPRQIVLATGEILFVHGAEVRVKRCPGQTVDDVPGVSFTGRVGLEGFGMTQCPLELPVSPVLGLDSGIRRRKEEGVVVTIIMTEKMASPDNLHMEPAGREGDNGDHEFPLVMASIGRRALDIDPRTGLWIDAVNIQDFVVQHVDNVVGIATTHG